MDWVWGIPGFFNETRISSYTVHHGNLLLSGMTAFQHRYSFTEIVIKKLYQLIVYFKAS
jgi:hypothetical protein